MSVISTLAVNLTARTGVFNRKMKKSRKVAKGFKTSLGTITKTLGAMGVAIGVAGFTYWIKSTMEAIDAVAKLSDRIGMSTENIVALGHAAKKAGASQDVLVKSLEIMVRRLGEVKMGVGQAKYALDNLGISADTLLAKSPDEAFELLSKRIMALPSAADRAVTAFYLMGRKGTELLNLMEDLSGRGLAGVRKEAERLGITFSRFDASKVEAANNALDDMKATLTGIGQELAIFSAPYIEAAAKSFTDWANEGESAGKKVEGMLDRMITKALWWEDIKYILKWENMSRSFAWDDRPSVKAKADLKSLTEEWLKNTAAAKESQLVEAERRKKQATAAAAADLFMDAFDPLVKFNEGLEEQIALFGKTKEQVTIWKLTQAGASLAEDQVLSYNMGLEDTIRLAQELANLNNNKSLADSIKTNFESLKDSLATPMEQAMATVKSSIQKLDNALKSNLITIKDYMESYNRIVDKFNEPLDAKINAIKASLATPLERAEKELKETLDALETAYIRNRISWKDMNKYWDRAEDKFFKTTGKESTLAPFSPLGGQTMAIDTSQISVKGLAMGDNTNVLADLFQQQVVAQKENTQAVKEIKAIS